MNRDASTEKIRYYLYFCGKWYLTNNFGRFMGLKPSIILLEFVSGETIFMKNNFYPEKVNQPVGDEEFLFIKLSTIDEKELERWLTR